MCVGIVFTAACAGTDGPVAQERGVLNLFVGTYVLQAIDGSALPRVFPPAGAPVEITRGTLTIRPDGTFVISDFLRNVPNAGMTSEETAGTYQITDTDITLVLSNRVFTGRLSGDNLSVLRGAPTFLYRR